MDPTSEPPVESRTTAKRFRSAEEKRQIVEDTLRPGASVTQVARAHGVNRDQVFHWRRLYRQGRLEGSGAAKLLAVRVAGKRVGEAGRGARRGGSAGTMEIELPRATLRITGAVDVATLRAALEFLAA